MLFKTYHLKMRCGDYKMIILYKKVKKENWIWIIKIQYLIIPLKYYNYYFFYFQ